ncbi:MAG: hypothetical protein AAF205_05995 [Pseudomonadota bacterium]
MTDQKTPADDGLDPEALKKTIRSDEELIPVEQLNEDIAVTGAPPRNERPQDAP